ncbi:MAG TPA: methyltransferase domain-containing protein [bacterium]|nr:methyltransferase domain-containing protein [bacterium]
MSESQPDMDFWRARYREGRTPWDLGDVSVPVRMLVKRWFPPQGRVLVPGCGRGHEALFLAEQGYDVTALDLAPEPLEHLDEQARKRGLHLNIRQGDMFALPAEDDGAYDVFLEQTCLCAVNPALHHDYEALAHRVLRPEGQFLAVFMRVPWESGPPFDIPPEQVWGLFPPERWEREGPYPVEPPNPARPGPEYLARMVRRG